MTRSQEFIWKNRKKLSDGPDFFNPDTSMQTMEEFEKAKIKFLLIFPTPHVVKTVSSTAAAINDFVIEHCPDCFIDFAYMPEGSDIKLFDDAKMPYAIGNITHLDPSHFDYIGFSISVLSEIVTAPVMMKSFERCDKPIPLFWSQRKNLPVTECPIIYCGGITAACGDIMFGEVGNEQAYLDFQYLGSCDKTDILFKRLIEAKETGKITRSPHDNDKPGYSHKEDPDFQTVVPGITVQDYIESLFDLDFCYQPQAYKVVFNKHNQIVENIKINPKARDYVTPYYPHELLPDLGIGRTIIPANGDNTGTAQTQVSEGCSASGACSFKVAEGTRIWTNHGLRRIESASTDRVVGLKLNESCKGITYQGKDEKIVVTTKDGHILECDKNHRWLVVNNDSLVEKKTWELSKGDVILRRLGSEPNTGSDISPELGELLGFMHGDGCFGKPYGKKVARWKIYMTEQERLHYEALFRKFIPTKSKTRVHYKSESTTIYVIEGNAVDFGFDIAPVSGHDLYVPDCIFNSSDIVRKAYLRGIFQADGYYTKDLGLTTISKKFAQDIALLLSSVGIDSTIRVNSFFERNKCDGHKVSFYVRIPASFEDKFIREIGFITKNHEPSSVENKTKANLPNLVVISDNVRKTCNRNEARELGLGQWFERPAGLISDESWRSLPDWVISCLPENSVRRMVASGQFVTDSIDSVINTGEVVDMYDVVGTDSSWCVYNDILTHNCAEGNYCGGWVEKSKDQILSEMWECKKYSAAYKYKPYSFNTNYITDYKGMLEKFIQIYPKVTFINMRLEELGRDTDALVMMKAIGSNRISAPIEGMSPRIQNNLLNKCLSQEAMDNFMNDLIHLKMTDIKVGGIFTCYEQDQDFQWICDYVHALKTKAKDEGGNIPFRLKCTPLVHYPLTPLEYLERKSAKNSLQGKRWLTDYWYDKFKENEIYFKVNGFRYSTFLEQSLVDLGRSITFMIHKHFVEPLAPIYSLRSVATDEFIEELKNFIDQDTFFETRDPEHYISIAHRIHIDLMGSYIPRARRLVRAYQAGDVFTNQPDIRCLKTYDGAKTMCQHNCILRDPLKIYSDVKMDEEGNLHGPYTLLNGCERCETPEQRLKRLKRPTPQTKNSDDIIAVPRIPIRQRVRFVIRRLKDYDVLSPNNTAHTFMTKFLQLSDNLLHKYHSIVNHNMFWNADPGLPYFVSGFQIVDTFWQDDVIDEIKSLIPQVNSMLKSVQVVSAKEELREEKIDINDINIWYFESELPMELFTSSAHMYDGEVKVMGGGMQAMIETIVDKDLKAPIFASKGKTVGYFALPCKYNPVLYLSSFLKAKKTSPAQVAQSTIIDCQMTLRSTNNVCKKCGVEKTLISITTGKPLPFGPQCVCKALLSQRLK